MENQELIELVIRIDQNLQNLVKDFKTASSEEGFNRCAARKIQIEALTKAVQEHKESTVWLWRSIAVVCISIIVQTIWEVVSRQ